MIWLQCSTSKPSQQWHHQMHHILWAVWWELVCPKEKPEVTPQHILRSRFSVSPISHTGCKFFHCLMEEWGLGFRYFLASQNYSNHSLTLKLLTSPLFSWSRKLNRRCESSSLSNQSLSAPMNSLNMCPEEKLGMEGEALKEKHSAI